MLACVGQAPCAERELTYEAATLKIEQHADAIATNVAAGDLGERTQLRARQHYATARTGAMTAATFSAFVSALGNSAR